MSAATVVEAAEATGSGQIECRDPATSERLGLVAVDSDEAVRAAVARAREAQVAWAAASFSERRSVLRRLLQVVLDEADELCDVIARDSGKTRENAMIGEIWPVCEKLRWTIKNGQRHLEPERVSSGLFVHKRAVIEYHPRGVVGVICPWNYPLQNILGPSIPALMAGNACVVKVSEAVAWSSGRFRRLVTDALEAAGYSPELFQIVNGYGETGAALVGSGVDLVVFTGSVENGRRVIAGSAAPITPVILELGGKDPMIICDDADLDEAVHAAMAGVFVAAGQNCLAAERLLVFDGIYDSFLAEVSRLVAELRQGPPLEGELVDVGATVSPRQVDLVERLVNDAVSRGATIVVGGQRGPGPGQFFEPTIITGVTDDMAIWREETFGPVMSIRRVSGEEEAIRLANGTSFGLSSTVFTRDRKRASRLARQLQAGSTCVNGFGITYMAQDLPFGGFKRSGFGRLNGREGLRACTNQKAVLYDRLPVHKPGKLFPVRAGDFEATREAIRLMYGRGPRAKLRHLRRLWGALRRRRSA